MSDHNDAVTRISQAFEEKGFVVQNRGNNLPRGSTRRTAIYRPDLLVRRDRNGPVRWIVEVETSEAGKSVVGAATLADTCMEIDCADRPNLLFVFYRPSTNLQLAEKRLEHLVRQRRVEHLGDITIMTEKNAVNKIRQL